MNNATTQSHIVWLDVIRTVAMLMVIGVHCIDPFYISPTLGSLPEYKHWAAVYGSLLRPSVPLFVMMTGLLLLPIREQSLGVFYKKRIYRVLFPFLIWSVLYNIFPWVTGLLGLTMPKFTSQILLLFSKVLHILENLLLKNFTGLKVVS